jgi:hypothetical protein
LNAAIMATTGRGEYVEGFAYAPTGRGQTITRHAWLTLDSVHATDITWPDDAPDCQYYGIIFDRKTIANAMIAHSQFNGVVRRFNLSGICREREHRQRRSRRNQLK